MKLMENNNREENNNNNRIINKLKIYLALFNLLILIDDIFLHYSEIKNNIFFFQLLSGEIIIFYLWISIRNEKIKLNKKLVLYYISIHSLISIIYCFQQIFLGTFTNKDVFKIFLFHQIIHIIIPIGLILYIVFFLKHIKPYNSINIDYDSTGLLDL